jgi:hypothetical protein
MSLGQWHFLRVDRSCLFDPVIADIFNLDEIIDYDRFVVGEIESKFRGSDQGTFLVDVIS